MVTARSLAFARLAIATGLGLCATQLLWCCFSARFALADLTDQLLAGALGAFAAARWTANRIPQRVAEVTLRHPKLWLLLGLLVVTQSTRLAAFTVDPSRSWAQPTPMRTPHSCLAAYVRAAELSRECPDQLYSTQHYRQPNGSSTSCRPSLPGLESAMNDAYHYPPPFLLLPRALLAVSKSFAVVRALWLIFHVGLFFAVAGFIVSFNDECRPLGLLLTLAVWISWPVTANFEFGQVHLITLAGATAAMVTIDRGREARGSLLLAAATVTKVFPAILLPYLLLRRRFRAVAWTAAALLGGLLLGWIILGARPYVEFFGEHLHRLSDGRAFVDMRQDPLAIADNYSVTGLVDRFEMLTRRSLPGAIARAGWAFSVGLIVLVVSLSRASRAASERAYLALLNLTAMRSPFAPGSYTLAGTVWLCGLQLPHCRRQRLVWLCLFWAAVQTLPFLGEFPLLWRLPALVTLVSFVGNLAVIGFNIAVVLGWGDGPFPQASNS